MRRHAPLTANSSHGAPIGDSGAAPAVPHRRRRRCSRDAPTGVSDELPLATTPLLLRCPTGDGGAAPARHTSDDALLLRHTTGGARCFGFSSPCPGLPTVARCTRWRAPPHSVPGGGGDLLLLRASGDRGLPRFSCSMAASICPAARRWWQTPRCSVLGGLLCCSVPERQLLHCCFVSWFQRWRDN
jgi:hypothetical protein